MYRLLRERGQSGERRAQATHPAKKKPELMADGPNQVWSWDITKLKGPARGVLYLLYVIIDIYSRKVICWDIWPTETGTLAKEFIEHAIAENGGIRPGAVHADRGTSMTSNTVAGLLAKLSIAQSHSRPHVSNDNPYSEAQFKTLKYCPAFPGRFGSIQDSSVFCAQFFRYYNNEHRHSGIAMHTPASVHDGTWVRIQARRVATLKAAFLAHPERFRGRRPYPPSLPARAWINQPPATFRPPPHHKPPKQPDVSSGLTGSGRAGNTARCTVPTDAETDTATVSGTPVGVTGNTKSSALIKHYFMPRTLCSMEEPHLGPGQSDVGRIDSVRARTV